MQWFLFVIFMSPMFTGENKSTLTVVLLVFFLEKHLTLHCRCCFRGIEWPFASGKATHQAKPQITFLSCYLILAWSNYGSHCIPSNPLSLMFSKKQTKKKTGSYNQERKKSMQICHICFLDTFWRHYHWHIFPFEIIFLHI